MTGEGRAKRPFFDEQQKNQDERIWIIDPDAQRMWGNPHMRCASVRWNTLFQAFFFGGSAAVGKTCTPDASFLDRRTDRREVWKIRVSMASAALSGNVAELHHL